jgi:hypothetical protein
MHSITFAEFASVLGVLLGSVGSVMGVMNYLRDTPKVKVHLKWDMTSVQTNEQMGVLTVTNVGRRPIFITAVALSVPKSFLILKESMSGMKFSEGDAPATFTVHYDERLRKYAKRWRDVRGYVEDSAGKQYISKKLPESDIPSWAKT